MIDIHCHILPGIDDGAKDLQETLEMGKIAVADGITTIVATPHQQNGVYHNSSEVILKNVETVTLALNSARIALEILPGADVYIDVKTAEKIIRGDLMTINNTGRYFLLEFPAHTVPPNIDKIIFNLLLKNIIPILTHPERIIEVQENPNQVYELVLMGVFSQITAMSLTGGFGRQAEKCAKTLLKHNLAHIIASDAHSVDSRPPVLSEAVQVASRIVGKEYATDMVTTFPHHVIKGESIPHLAPPIPVKRKFFGLFR
jgi:protein-tyrosine phosphatase